MSTSDQFVIKGEKYSPFFRANDMCDSCGTKINLINRKSCHSCQQYFCGGCIRQAASKGSSICQTCTLLSYSVVKRSQLLTLSQLDLKHYVKRSRIETSLNPSFDDLIEIILSRQAKKLIDRANEAIKQLNGLPPGTDVHNIRISELHHHSTAYSSSGAGGNLQASSNMRASEGVDGSGGKDSGATSIGEGLHIRKKVKKSVDFANVNSIEELDSEEDVGQLSVKQLKIILQRNCINYKGCVEKDELLAKVKTLWRAKEEARKTEARINEAGDLDAESDFLCKVCMDAPVDCVLLDCGHMLSCVRCGRQLAECPVCRQYVVRVVHAFKV